MYTDYILYFQISGIILLLAMIGAILLTYKKREGLKRQSYITQITREPSTSIEIKEVEFNKGVKLDD
jgi:NADH-quinone oxidoreductase subunit J